MVELLEDRVVPAGTVTITAIQGPATTSAAVPIATEGTPATPSLNATFTDTNAVAPNQLTVTINYGDGTTPSTNQGPNADPNLLITQVGGAGGTTYTVTDIHTFPEESGSTVPPFAFAVTMSVTENANAANTDTANATAQVLDAALAVGNPVTKGTTTTFFGGDAGNATTAAQAVANFQTAIGGVQNKAPAPQTGGFRVINWDGVKTDGTDSVAGPNSTVVIPPIGGGATKTVGIPLDRFQGQGVFFGAVYAVSSDGFVDLNPSATGLFPAFSTPNTFAMFNDNGIDFKFVTPSGTNTALVPALSSGFGAIFLNVQNAGTTTIQYFHGQNLLDTLTVPTNPTPGAAVFAGERFTTATGAPANIVTNVLLTLGNNVIFKFDGTTATSGPTNGAGTGIDGKTNNLVAVDDWDYPEPVPAPNGFSIVDGGGGTTNAASNISATAGTAFTGTVGTFSDLDPNGNAKDYTAVINWGDGHQTNGTITANAAGGFDVSGTNTYATSGKFSIAVDVADFGGGPGLGGSSPTQSIVNTATVVGAPVVTTASSASTGFTSGTQAVILSATLSGSATPISEGTVTFQVLQGSSVVASAVGAVVNSSSHSGLTLPAGLAAGSYSIRVSFSDPGGKFADGGDVSSTLTVTPPAIASFTTTTSFFGVTVQATAADGTKIGPGLFLPAFLFPFPAVTSVTMDASGNFDVHLSGLFFGLFPFPLDVFFNPSGNLIRFALG
jgi:hypothetical protein